MVLRLKTWESRSPPNLVRNTNTDLSNDAAPNCLKFQPWGLYIGAGWSSPVARQAHNLKVVGSNPTPATKKILIFIKYLRKLPLGWVDLRSLKIAAFIATFALCVARQPLACAVILILQEGYFTS